MNQQRRAYVAFLPDDPPETPEPTAPTGAVETAAVSTAGRSTDTAGTALATGAPVDRGQTSPRYLTSFDTHSMPVRNPDLEALWFRLSSNGFESTALVAVPPLSGGAAYGLALNLARIGGILGSTPVHALSLLDLEPAVTAAATRELPDDPRTPLIIAADAPTVGTGGFPAFAWCSRVVLVTGRGQSTVEQSKAIIEMIGADRIFGSVTVEPAPRRRRWWHIRGRRRKDPDDGSG